MAKREELITEMNCRRIDDWSTLSGATVEIRQQGSVVSRGTVDAVTDDGKILWIYSRIDGRRLFEKVELYEAWATKESVGFHYKVSNEQAAAAGVSAQKSTV